MVGLHGNMKTLRLSHFIWEFAIRKEQFFELLGVCSNADLN